MDQVEYQKYVDKVNTNVKLMNKSLRMIISFFASFIIGVILLMILQLNGAMSLTGRKDSFTPH